MKILKTLRILLLIFLSIICVFAIFLTINRFYYSDLDNNMVGNPEHAGLVAGIEYLVFLSLISLGSIFSIISIIDLAIEKNKISLINLILSITIVIISCFYL